MHARLHRFNQDDFLYWTQRVGPWFDPSGPSGHHLLRGRQLDLTMAVGLYVGVEDPDRALYVGKVRRRDAGIRSRLLAHHQRVEAWDAIWLLPLRSTASDMLVRRFELGIIRMYRPPGNVRGLHDPQA